MTVREMVLKTNEVIGALELCKGEVIPACIKDAISQGVPIGPDNGFPEEVMDMDIEDESLDSAFDNASDSPEVGEDTVIGGVN